MIVSVWRSANRPPETFEDPTHLAFRDYDGNLLRLVLFLKDGSSMLTATKGDADFESVCAEVGVQLKVDPCRKPPP